MRILPQQSIFDIALQIRFILALKLAHGQLGNRTVNRTNGVAQNKTEAYGDALMDVIRNTNITIPLDLHPTTEQLEQITDTIVISGNPIF